MLRVLKALPLTLAIAAVAALSIIAASCTSSHSQARFVNAIPDAGALDIDFNGTKDFSAISFPTASGSTYTSVPAGSDTIEGLATGTTTVAFPNQTLSLNAGSQYTLVATGFLSGTVTLLNPVDTNTAPANGTVSFRVINASPSGPASVDIYILPNLVTCQLGSTGCMATISALGYQSTSTYANQAYNSSGLSYTLYVTPAGSTTPLFSYPIPTVGSLTVGSIRTLLLTDVAGGGAMNDQPIVLNDLN